MQALIEARRLEKQGGAAAGPFRHLVGEAAWKALPRAVQARFSRVLAPGESAAYLGEVASTRMTLFGWCWAQVARLAGAPLPLKVLERTAAAVLVTEDAGSDTQMWTRLYHEAGHLPQVIRSMKRFAGPTGLEECVGAGIGMSLAVTVEQRAFVFRSTAYFWRAGRFSFTLTVTHPWFGETMHQVGFFRDAC